VDDELEPLLPLADVLRRCGFVATIATSDDEALFAVRMSPPDVVVLDAEMADRSLFWQLRALVPKLPVVLMINSAIGDSRISAMHAIDGIAFVEKPVGARQLIGLLRCVGADGELA